jgi:hypothetical protein
MFVATRTITPSGDSPEYAEIAESPCLASNLLWRKHMLEWKPRLIVLLVAVASVASSFGWLFSAGNFGWGAW